MSQIDQSSPQICQARSGKSQFSLLALSWSVIIAVSGVDTFFTLKHSSIMQEVELNPVGRLVLNSQGGIPLFVGLKSVGLALALLFIFGLWQKESLRPRVLVSSCVVAVLSVGAMGLMFVDVEGRELAAQAQMKRVMRALEHLDEMAQDSQSRGSGTDSGPRTSAIDGKKFSTHG